MGKFLFLFAGLVLCYFFKTGVCGYKVLGVFPSTSRSHHILGSALLRGLAAKGHEVSTITAFPDNEKIKNYEEIPIPEILVYYEDLHKNLQNTGDKFILQLYNDMIDAGRTLSARVLEQPIIQDLLTNRTFDLVICEVFVTEALYGFGQHFNAPLIGLSPMRNSLWSSVLSGAPVPASFVPNVFLANTGRMNYAERALNLAVLTIQYLGYHFNWLPYQSKVYNKFFPHAKITLPEVMKNFSLILLNQHFSIGNSEPHLHNMIEVGGLHIKRERKPLPLEIQTFLDDAHDGAIYFSLGTNWKSKSLRKDKLEAILNTFKDLKQRVLWKYENSSLPGKSDNVLIRDWFPQSDILAHPNVKLFISHGGMLGTTEAVYHGKPLLGIPMLCDQFINIARAVESGYALKVPTSQLTEDIFKNTIIELLTNLNYSLRAKQASTTYRDQPMEPLETAIYWIEYVLRHKGAHQLRSSALDLNFFQYHSLDTISVVYGGVLLILFSIYWFFKSYVSSIFRWNKAFKLKVL